MAAKTYYSPFIPAFSSNGAPVPGAKLNFYYTGTNTRAPIYSNAELTIELTNPVQADAAGKFPTIYLDDTYIYRVVQTDRNDAQLGDAIDPYIPGSVFGGGGGGDVGYSGDRVFLVREQILEGDTDAFGAVRRTRDLIAAAGGGVMMFDEMPGQEGVTKYEFGELQQTPGSPNTGNLTSNMRIESTGNVELWLKRSRGPFLFFCDPGGVGAPHFAERVFNNITFGRVTMRDDHTRGAELNSALVHLSAVSNVLFDGTKFIGGRGHHVMLAAGPLGPDEVSGIERQNRFNYDVVFRGIHIDGIDKNCTNGVAIVSGKRVHFEGGCVIENVCRPGGAATYDPMDINTGVGGVGGVDIEPNSFTGNPLVQDITGIVHVQNSGSLGVGVLLFGQRNLTNKFSGISMTPIGRQCRLGSYGAYSDDNEPDAPLVVFDRPKSIDCDMWASITRCGPTRVIQPEHINCPNAAELGYWPTAWGANYLEIIDGIWNKCGTGGALMRLSDSKGMRWPGARFHDCAGAITQITGPVTLEDFQYSREFTRTDETVDWPVIGFQIDETNGIPVIDSKSIIDTSAEPPPMPDSSRYQVRGQWRKSAPDAGIWSAGNEMRATAETGPGGPAGWEIFEGNENGGLPGVAVTRYRAGGLPFATGSNAATTLIPPTKVMSRGNGVYESYINGGIVHTNAAYAVTEGAPGVEVVFAMPHPGERASYFGFARQGVSYSYDPSIEDEAVRFADFPALVWPDGDSGPLTVVVNGDPFAFAPTIPLNGQLKAQVAYQGGAPLFTFSYRAGATGSFTKIGPDFQIGGSITGVVPTMILGPGARGQIISVGNPT